MAMDHEEHGEQIANLKTEVHGIKVEVHGVNSAINEIKSILKSYAPRQLSVTSIIAIGVSMVAILGGLFASVIFISSSSNAPLMAQIAQVSSVMQDMKMSMSKNTSLIQLTIKEISTVGNKADGNAQTLNWVLFEKNLPEKITLLEGRVNSLEEKAHLHPSMTIK